MTPAEAQRLLRRIQDSMDASHRLHQELLAVVRAFLEQQPASLPSPAPKPMVPDKSAGPLYFDTRGPAERLDLSPKTLEK